MISLNRPGDANDSGIVDIQDQSLITNNWQQQSAFSLDSSFPQFLHSSPSPTPEPATLLLIFPAFLLLGTRRGIGILPMNRPRLHPSS